MIIITLHHHTMHRYTYPASCTHGAAYVYAAYVYAAPGMHDVSIIHQSMHVVACILGVFAWLESITGSKAS